MSKLLLVDDDTNTLASLSRAFRLAGHEAVVCDQADRALELAKSQRFDMIFSDVVMPGKTGCVLAEELGARCPEMKIIFMSGYGERVALVKAHQEPRMSHLSKPFSVQALLRKVRDLLDKKNSPTLVKVATRAAGSR